LSQFTEYSEHYIEQCFQFWYAATCPSYKVLHDLMIEKGVRDEFDRIPSHEQLKNWGSKYSWSARRDAIEADASQKMHVVLVDQTVSMWKAHAEAAREVAMIALEKIRTDGFDSSASAISAIKWAQEEERKTRGAEAFIEKLKNSSNSDLLDTIRELMERSAATEDVVDAKEGTE
jgi:hypothetical protein